MQMMVAMMTMAMMMLVNGAVVQAVAQPGVVKVDRKWCSPKILLQIDLGRGQHSPLQVYYSGRQGSAEKKTNKCSALVALSAIYRLLSGI